VNHINFGDLTVKIEKGINLAQLLFGGIRAIIAAARAGHATVTKTSTGEVLSADVLESVARAQGAALAAGDAAEDRIEDRHPGSGV
jgi:hypothetical protein